MTRNKRTNLPTNSSVNSNGSKEITVRLILRESLKVKRSNGNFGAVNRRRPNVDFFVTLVGRWYGGSVSDLLATVGDVGVETVVVDADVVVGIS